MKIKIKNKTNRRFANKELLDFIKSQIESQVVEQFAIKTKYGELINFYFENGIWIVS
jgi:hypothetical protein